MRLFFALIFFSLALFAQDADSVTMASKKAPEVKKDIEKIETGTKILVIYFTRSGNTEKVAKSIANALNADIERIVDKNKSSYFVEGMAATFNMSTDIEKPKKKPGDYEIVIIGTPIWSWSMTPAVRSYIEQYKKEFKKVAFFTTAGGTKPNGIVEDMEKLSGKKALGFTGILEDELEDKKVFEKKINSFVKIFKKE